TTERLARSEPKNASWQRDLASAHDSMGDLFRFRAGPDGFLLAASDGNDDVSRTQDNLAAALKSYRAGLDIRARMAGADSSNTFLQYELAISHGRIGEAFLRQRDVTAPAKAVERRQGNLLS